MLLEKPVKVAEEDLDWVEIYANKACKLERYRRGGVGKGLHTIQSILTVAKLVHGSPRMASAGVPWDFRIITAFPVCGKPWRPDKTNGERASSDSHVDKGTTEKEAGVVPKKYVWQLAGSNNLLHCKQDMDSLVLKLNSLMTEVDMSTLLPEKGEPRDWAEKYAVLAALLESISQELQLRMESEADEIEPSAVPLLRARSSSVSIAPDWSDVMQLVVFIVLPPSELFKCAQVCRAWNKLASHDVLWEGHLVHLNQSLGIMDSKHMKKAVGKMVVDGVVTYKFLYSTTFLEAVRRRNDGEEEDGEGFLDGRLYDVADHDVRRVMVRGLFGVTTTMKTGLQEVGKGIKDAGSGVAVGAIGGLLMGGSMAARLGGRAPMGGVTRSAFAVGGGVLGGVGGAVGGTIVGAVSAVPFMVRGCVARPLGGMADLLHDAANVLRKAPEDIMGGSGKDLTALLSEEKPERKELMVGGLTEGLQTGLHDLRRELREGVQGLYAEPMAGTRESGLEGMVWGGGKGVMGAVCRPVAGTLMLGEAVARGVSNTAERPSLLFGSRHASAESDSMSHRSSADESLQEGISRGATGGEAESAAAEDAEDGVLDAAAAAAEATDDGLLERWSGSLGEGAGG